MKRGLKVIHFVTSIDRKSGGITAYLQSLAESLSGKLDLIIVTGESAEPVEIDGVKIYFLNLSVRRYCSIKREFRRILKSESPDMIHVNGIWQPQTWWFQQEAQKQQIRVVLSPHGMLEPWILNRHSLKKRIALFLFQRKAIHRADLLHATAQREAEQFRKLGFVNPIEIIPNGVDLSMAIPKSNWDKTKTILFLSRIHPKKGIEILIEAVFQLKTELADWKIIIAGEGEDEYVESLKKNIQAKGISDLFDFVGGVYGDAKWELFRKADLFVLPTYSENFGIVVAEALACGTPVITTTGTPWDEINAENCGWCIDLSVVNIKSVLIQFLSLSVIELEVIGRKGRELVVRKFDSNSVAISFFSLCNKFNHQK